jgi:ribosome biogenesis GTPase
VPRELDEDDVRVRPPRSTRPRTKSRPGHHDAATGQVVTVDRGRYAVRVGDPGVVVSAVRARELGRRAVVVGDLVSVVGDLSGGPDALARVVRVHERSSLLRRTPDDTDPVERAVVANADLLVVVMSLADPEPRPRLIDRCLVAAHQGGLHPLLCLTKADLAAPDAMREAYEPLGVEVLVTARGSGVEELRERLTGHTSVLFGQSGVGKSTLVNQLVPDAGRAVGEVTGAGKGRHTSSSAIALPLPGGGTVIDTPGVRSFGLGHVPPERIVAAFPDLAPGAEECEVGCDHLGSSCRLDEWVREEGRSPERLASMRSLLRSRDGEAE